MAARARPTRSSPRLPTYRGARAERVVWPLGGLGASQFGLTGSGTLDRISNRHLPDLRQLSHSFAALSVPGRPALARVLEGPVPPHKRWSNGLTTTTPMASPGFGHAGGPQHGLPHLARTAFTARFPFARVALAEEGWPFAVEIEAWSPFIPGDADASGLPVAALTYRIANPGARRRRAVFSYHALTDVLRLDGASPDGERIRRTPHGFAFDYPALADRPWSVGGFAAEIDGAQVDAAWFRGGWFDARTERWDAIATAGAAERAPHADGECGGGASLWLPLEVPAGGTAEVTVRLSWYEPRSRIRHGAAETPAEVAAAVRQGAENAYRPRYAHLHEGIDAVAAAFRRDHASLKARTRAFGDALHATSVPPVALEAVTANLGILRSPTVLRQHDGRLWAWEGSGELDGSCPGSCSHVWNYAQALAHLFPELERTLRETEFGENQDDRGHQHFRAALPIRPTNHDFHAAADGQLGGLVKLWREWQLGGDLAWLQGLWPRARQSLLYCIDTWDPERTGALVEPHHNTYDVEFWGPDGMCGSVYAAALAAAAKLAAAVGDDPAPWQALAAKAARCVDGRLFRRGRYVQDVVHATPRAGDCTENVPGFGPRHSPEALELLRREGPKYQYGEGVLSDGVIGAWLAEMAGLPPVLSPAQVRSHLAQVHRHNLRRSLVGHANPQRPTYAMGDEGGLLLCSWPDGDRPRLPFVYSEEVWTGVEYQVASHCILAGLVDEGLEIVRIARARYDGRRRNPFDEIECGHWYARALSSWALLPALTGVRYSAVERTLWIRPASKDRPFRAYLGVGGSFGTITLSRHEVAVELVSGRLAVDRLVLGSKSRAWGVTAVPGRRFTLALPGEG